MANLLKELGIAVLLSQDELLRLIRSAPHRYKVFKIPKRKQGEFRDHCSTGDRGQGSSVLGNAARLESIRRAPSCDRLPEGVVYC